MRIAINRQWDRQPPPPVELDPRHPATHRAELCFVGSSPLRDAATRGAIGTTPDVLYSRDFVGPRYYAAGGEGLALQDGWQLTFCSGVVVFNQKTDFVNTFPRLLSFNDKLYFSLGNDGGSHIRTFAFDCRNSSWVAPDNSVAALNTSTTVGFAWDGDILSTSCRLSINGRSVPVTFFVGSNTDIGENNFNRRLYGRVGGLSRAFDGAIGLAMVCRAIWSEQLLNEVTGSPWRLFKRPHAVLYRASGAISPISLMRRAYGPDGQRVFTGLRR